MGGKRVLRKKCFAHVLPSRKGEERKKMEEAGFSAGRRRGKSGGG